MTVFPLPEVLPVERSPVFAWWVQDEQEEEEEAGTPSSEVCVAQSRDEVADRGRCAYGFGEEVRLGRRGARPRATWPAPPSPAPRNHPGSCLHPPLLNKGP